MTKYKQSLKTKVYKINQGFITQKIGNKTTIFQGEESVLFTLNQSAAYIFNGLKLGWEKEKIIDGLVTKFGVKKEAAKVDVDQFASDLLKKKILTQAGK